MGKKQPVSFDTSSRVVNQVGSKYALSWWVIVYFSIPTFLAQLVFDQSRLGGNFSVWLQLAFAAQTVAVLVFGLGRIVLLPLLTRNRVALVLLFYGLVGLARSTFLHFAAVDLGLEAKTDFAYRIFTGPVYAITVMSVCAVMVSNVKRHRELQSELAQERGRLRLASAKLQSQVDSLRAELVARVAAMIDPAIQNLESKLEQVHDPSTTSIAVVDLRNTVEDVIRPLSHDLAKANFDQLMLQTEDQIRSQVVPRLQKVAVTLLPNFSAILVFSVSVGTTTLTRGLLVGLVLSLVCTLGIWLWTSVIQRLVNQRRFRVWIAGLIYLGSFFSGALTVELVTQGIGIPITESEQFGAQTLLTLMGLVFFLATVANEIRLANVEKLRVVNRRYQLLNSQLRRQVWLDYRRVASVLHGQLQGALYAAAMRLNQAAKPDRELIEDVRAEIYKAVNALSHTENGIEDFVKVYYEIIDLWSDSVKFTTDFTQEASQCMRDDLGLAECVLEVVREAINNAIKHGKASELTVAGKMLNAQLLEVTVTNNGAPADEASSQGFGSEVLTQCTHTWRLQNTSEGVRLTATFAV